MAKRFNLIVTPFLILGFVYFGLRFIYPETIEFGYDQPKTAQIIINFLKRGSFISSQEYTQETVAGSVAWGPSLVYFFAPFFLITKNPIYVSYLIASSNFISVLLVFLIGRKIFSLKVGFLAALIFSCHPWWIIFSRMIYQPTPVPLFISASLLFLFNTIKRPNSYWLSLLIISWGVLFQSYLITSAFVFASFTIILFSVGYKKLLNKNLFAGLVSLLIIFLPSFVYYKNNPDLLSKFLIAGEKYKSSFVDTFKHLFSVLSGGDLKWQLGYGYNDFLNLSGLNENIFLIFFLIILLLFFFGLFYLIKDRNKTGIYLFLLTVIPLWAIPLIGVENIVPRYFLFILPQFSLFFAFVVSAVIQRFGKIAYLIPLIFILFWTYLTINYFKFIKNFDYPNGFLSNWSDVPYSFVDKSFKWIGQDSKSKEYDTYVVSSDTTVPDGFRFNHAQEYYWKNVLGKDLELNGTIGYYLMYLSPVDKDYENDYKRFGPYIVLDATNFVLNN